MTRNPFIVSCLFVGACAHQATPTLDVSPPPQQYCIAVPGITTREVSKSARAFCAGDERRPNWPVPVPTTTIDWQGAFLLSSDGGAAVYVLVGEGGPSTLLLQRADDGSIPAPLNALNIVAIEPGKPGEFTIGRSPQPDGEPRRYIAVEVRTRMLTVIEGGFTGYLYWINPKMQVVERGQ